MRPICCPGLEERHVYDRGARLRLFAGGDGPAPPARPRLRRRRLELRRAGAAPCRAALLIPDLPGHAGSSPLPAAPSLAAFADALAPASTATRSTSSATRWAGSSRFGSPSAGPSSCGDSSSRRPPASRARRAAPSSRSRWPGSSSPAASPAGAPTGSRARRGSGDSSSAPFEVANPGPAHGAGGARAAARADAAHRRARRRQGAHRRRPAPRPRPRDGARSCCSGAPTTARYRSRTPSNTPGGCALPCA